MSSLARILVSVTCGRKIQNSVPLRVADGGDPPQDQTHADSTDDAASENAQRKARALWKHRSALVRWASKEIAASDATNAAAAPTRDATVVANTTRRGADIESNGGDRCASVATRSVVRRDLLSLVSAEGLGRHVVAGTVGAAGAIPAGTLLLREMPFAWCLRPEFADELCPHCLCEMARSPVLCRECGKVAFCSPVCAAAAHKIWHGDECLDASGTPLEPAMSDLSTECRVALRACRRARRGKTRNDTDDALRSASRSTQTAEDIAARADRCVTPTIGGDDGWSIGLRDLEAHYVDRPPRELDLLATEAAIAAVLACGGGGGGDGGGTGGGSYADVDAHGCNGKGGVAFSSQFEELAAGVVTALVKVSTNAFAVSALRRSESGIGPVQTLTHDQVAVGLYSLAAMLNHSCIPNALATFDGAEMTVVATRPIEKGEPVTVSYGPLASKVSSTLERRRKLQDAYFFMCKCVACHPVQHSTSPRDAINLTLRDEATVARSKRTDFVCMEGGCSGALLVGERPRPLLPRQIPSSNGNTHKLRHEGKLGQGASKSPVLASPSSSSSSGDATMLPSLSKGRIEMWCDRCGVCIAPRTANVLLKEDEEDRRLWADVMNAVAESENGQTATAAVGSGIFSSRSGESRVGGERDPPTPGSSSSTAPPPAELVLRRARWRDRRLSPLAMRRAVAHDTMARLLAGAEDFAGAADHCELAIRVLERRYAPEDRALGVEFLKLAELWFNAGSADRCIAACKRARVSLEVCLDARDEQLVALNSMQGICVSRMVR